MPSAATTRNKLEKQAPGENSGTWGTKEGVTLDQIDAALDGVFDVVTASGTTTLADANYTADDAKNRVLNCTGTGGTIVIPNVEKVYMVRNGSSGNITISTGSGTTATIASGITEWVFSTGGNVVYGQGLPVAGTYTPTFTSVTNVTATTAYGAQYMRVGEVVTVSGKVDVTPTAGSSTTQVGISLPVSSDISSQQNCCGSAGAVGQNSVAVWGDATNDRALMTWTSVGTSNTGYFFQFTYRVA